jgi:hypothetical protein
MVVLLRALNVVGGLTGAAALLVFQSRSAAKMLATGTVAFTATKRWCYRWRFISGFSSRTPRAVPGWLSTRRTPAVPHSSHTVGQRHQRDISLLISIGATAVPGALLDGISRRRANRSLKIRRRAWTLLIAALARRQDGNDPT